MPYVIRFNSSAQKAMARLRLSGKNEALLRRRLDALRRKENPKSTLEKLHGGLPGHKLRAGEFRVILNVDDPKKEITVVEVMHRQAGYGKKTSERLRTVKVQ